MLARSIVDGAGETLLREGTILTKAVIARIAEAGAVDEIFVKPPPMSDDEKAAKRLAMESRAQRMFAEHQADPVMQALARVSAEILARRT